MFLIKWGLGIGDWGLGIGDWAQSPIPNPQFKFKFIIKNNIKKNSNNLIILLLIYYNILFILI